MNYQKEKVRSYIVYVVFFTLFLSLFLRLAYLQIVKKDFLFRLAKKQHLKIIPVRGERGNIFDIKMRLLATDINSYSVYVDPFLVSDSTRLAEVLSSALSLQKDKVYRKLSRDSRFVWIKRHISFAEKQKIEDICRRYKGVGLLTEKKRFYPQAQLMGQVLGGVNVDDEGIEGVERFYNRYLAGKKGWASVIRDSSSQEVFIYPELVNFQRGMDIVLTIDAQIQYWVEKYLAQTIEKFTAKGGSVVVMDAYDGSILALANYPFCDPNRFGKYPPDIGRNKAVTDVFEPGSVFKIVTLVGALQENLFKLDDKIFCENGIFKIPGSILHDWRPYGELSFKDVFKKSSNIGVAKIAAALGKNKLYRYIRRLGFGERTGVDIAGESPGLLKSPERWSKTSPYIIPIGQEVGVTVLQLARAMCVIANGGYLVKPHILDKLSAPYGFEKKFSLKKVRVIPQAVAQAAKNILIEVVNDGTGRLAKIDGITIGGKTGTAQKFDKKIHRYSSHAYRASFVGFVEKNSKVFVVCVSIDEPKRSHFGGVVAAPLFKKIAEKLIVYDTESTVMVKN